MLLAAVGIYGVMAYMVAQRTNEIGLRMALGARPLNVLSLLVRQAFVMIGSGLAIGLVGALALTRVLSGFLFGIVPEDPATFASVLMLLAFVALAACVVAARRALQIDPARAMRSE